MPTGARKREPSSQRVRGRQAMVVSERLGPRLLDGTTYVRRDHHLRWIRGIQRRFSGDGVLHHSFEQADAPKNCKRPVTFELTLLTHVHPLDTGFTSCAAFFIVDRRSLSVLLTSCARA